MRYLMPLLLLAVLSFACAPHQEDVAGVRKQIEAMNDQMEKELVSGVWDTTFANYADDAISMPNQSPIMRGKKAFKEHAVQMAAMGMKFTKVDFTTTDVMVSGNMAYEIGTYSMTLVLPAMGEMTDVGKYVTIYEKATDGKWKIKVETWNTDKQPAMPMAGS